MQVFWGRILFQRAFSLVELSIVLVILGLLTGGILAGQSLIRASELRSVVTQSHAYQAAAMTFRDKYMSFPGDFKDASRFWGYPGGNPANCPATAGTGTETCNGNGNGILDATPAVSQYGERFLFWQHLANAGLIEGQYTGRAGSASISHAIPGTNSPRSKIGNGLFRVNYRVTDLWSNGTTLGNSMAIVGGEGGDVSNPAILTGEEMWNLDTKLDDGRPAWGRVYAGNMTDSPNCSTSDDAATASYVLGSSTIACRVNLKIGI